MQFTNAANGDEYISTSKLEDIKLFQFKDTGLFFDSRPLIYTFVGQCEYPLPLKSGPFLQARLKKIVEQLMPWTYRLRVSFRN